MTDTFAKYLFEVAPVVGVMGWWIYSLMTEKKALGVVIREKEALHFQEVAYNKERDKANLQTIMETSSVLEALTTALSASETKFVMALGTKTEEVKRHIDKTANEIRLRLIERGKNDDHG